MSNNSTTRLKNEISAVSKMLFAQGHVRASGGNVSGTLGEGESMWITPGGFALCNVTPESLVEIGRDGTPLTVPEGLRPSYETVTHLTVYRTVPGARAVIHTHSPYATAYASRGKELPMETVTARKVFGKTPVVPLAPAGSEELATLLTQTLQENPEYKCFLLEDHGVLCYGNDPWDAFHLTEFLEETAHAAWIIKQI